MEVCIQLIKRAPFKVLRGVAVAALICGSGCAARTDASTHEVERLRARVAELEEAHHRDNERLEDLSTRLVGLESRPAKGRPDLPIVRVRAESSMNDRDDDPSDDGREVGDDEGEDEVGNDDGEVDDDEPRPVLKIHASRFSASFAPSTSGSRAPRRSKIDLGSVNERLPIVPIPNLPGTLPLDTAPASLPLAGGEAAPGMPEETTPAIEEMVARARSQVRSGDCGAALQVLAQVLAQSPEHPLAPEAMLLRARCHRRQGAPLRAIGELERLSRRYPNSGHRVSALFEMAEAFVSLGDLDRSREIFSEIMRRYPRSRAASRATVRVQELGRGRRAREE